MKLGINSKLLFLCLFCHTVASLANPALRVKKKITLADGTTKSVYLCGDENMHFYTDDQKRVYTSDFSDRYTQANKEELMETWAKRLSARNLHRIRKAEARKQHAAIRKAQWGAEQNPISGKRKGLVILVNFADRKFHSTHDQKFFDGYFNTVNFSEQGAKGSVHDYFIESSYGQFDLTFDVIGPVTVSRNMSYYGGNYGNFDMYPAQMISEACILADKQGIDFSKYDWDNDGNVDQVYVVYAGYGESMGGDANTIWPHEGTLSDAAPYGDGDGAIKLDGVTIDTYATSCELLGSTGSYPASIGTACHEFAHCMCIPDMYDTNYENYGMNAWDLMDFGSYNGNLYGESPAPFTSYERMYCGWLTPTELTTPCKIAGMKALNEAPEAYILYNSNNRNEYYLFENRQPIGFGTADPAKGLLILHVTFDQQAWTANTVNSALPQRMTIIPADGILSADNNNGDTWPGITHKTELTDESTPAATLNTANSDGRKFMGRPIEEITETNGTISFIFDGGMVISSPTATHATNITDNSFTANWDAIPGIDNYQVLLFANDKIAREYPIEEFETLNENFSKFNNGTTANGTVDISQKLDDFTKSNGWEGAEIYTTPREEIRLGAFRGGQKVGGQIVTPWIESNTKNITLSFTIRSYSTDTEPVYLIIGDEENIQGKSLSSFDVRKDPTQYTITTSVNTNKWWWGLVCKTRCYVSNMITYEGEISDTDIRLGYISMKKNETMLFDVHGTSLDLTDLTADREYEYMVRAKSGHAYSPWSETVRTELTDESLNNTTSILPTEVNQSANSIYDLQGRVSGRNNRPKGVIIINRKKYAVK